jgi:predicted enzyme related to lactoylglutathione lyase
MEIIVNIDVDDLERAVSFYEEALGLRAGRRLFDGAVAEMLGATVPVYLLAKKAGTQAVPADAATRDYRRHWTPVHLDIVVEKIAPAVERAVAAGAKLERAAETFPWGRLALLSDPFGHGFCLVEFTGKRGTY